MSDVTRILTAIEQGDAKAADELLPLVYQELRQLAVYRMAHEAPGQTLQPTALVHEAWLRVSGGENKKWDGRGHFFAAAAEAMRRILIDNARRKHAVRHGGKQRRAEAEALDLVAAPAQDDELLAMHDALEKFAARDKQKAELVKLRYFAGMTIGEAAEVLGISEPTAKRWWTFARAWLYREIQGERPETPP